MDNKLEKDWNRETVMSQNCRIYVNHRQESDPDKIPDLHWKLVNTYHTTNIGQTRPQATDISTHCIDVDTISYVGGAKYGNWCGTTLNTDTITLQSNVKPVVCPITYNNEYKI